MRCRLLTKRSALVLKVVVYHMESEMFKRRRCK